MSRLWRVALLAVFGLLAVPGRTGSVEAHDGAVEDPQSRAAELIERYAPILMLRRQDQPCDGQGEPYMAAPVEIVLGDPAVRLVGHAASASSALVGPTVQDLVGAGDGAYLDFPGNPLRPGCAYERRSRERMRTLTPTALARIGVERGRDGLVIQYWLFYYFNDWNNTHEGDWEMVQVVFDVGTVEGALRSEPTEVGFSQHAGGERADWDDPKLERDGTRPVVYAARGSHASHFDRAVYLGWGENGTGVGCDDTRGPSVAVPLQGTPIADDSRSPPWRAPWLRFTGRWGQRAPWEFDGPSGPHLTGKWLLPLTWQDGLREASLAVPLSGALGPAPTAAFCEVTAASAVLLRHGTEQPALFVAGGLLLLVLAGGVVVGLWRTLAETGRLYIRHFPAFLPAALTVVALAAVVSGARLATRALAPHGPAVDLPELSSALSFSFGIAQQLVGLVLVAPAAVFAVQEVRMGRRPDWRTVMRFEASEVARTTRALARPLLAIGLVGLLPFGIVLAAVLLLRWLFIPQAVLIDGMDPAAARRHSWNVVRGRTRQGAALAAVLAALVVGLGPVIGVLVMIYAGTSIEVVNVASSAVYALVYPFVFAAATVWYLDRAAPMGEG